MCRRRSVFLYFQTIETMRRITYIFTMILACVSCKNDDIKLENVEAPSVEFTFAADILSRSSLDDIKKNYVEGDRIACFTKPYYNELAKAELHEMVCMNNLFRSEIPVMVYKGNPQYVYAVYPYGEYDNPNAIPIDITTQTEYLYASSMISFENPSPSMQFSHMLSVLAFNFSDKIGGRKIERISVGETIPIPLEGNFNSTTSLLTHTKRGEYALICNQEIPNDGMKDSLPQFFVLPHSMSDGLNVRFTVSGTVYECTMPVRQLERGRKYIFSIAFSQNSAALLETTVVALDSDQSIMPESSVSRLRIRHSCRYFTIPDFLSDTMYGIISWGDGSTETFSATAVHSYNKEGVHETDIEIWNPKSVTFDTLTGIEHIDFSSF